MKSINADKNPASPSFEEVLSGMTSSGQYDHLRLILSKNDNLALGQKYLMVSRNAFGLVRLNNVDFDDNQIQMDLQDTITGMIKRIHLDINDTSFKFILISWQDINEMRMTEVNQKSNHDDLLEFDF